MVATEEGTTQEENASQDDAGGAEANEDEHSYSSPDDQVIGFLQELGDKLGVSANVIAGYEDPVHLVIAEENLPCEEI